MRFIEGGIGELYTIKGMTHVRIKGILEKGWNGICSLCGYGEENKGYLQVNYGVLKVKG